MKSYGMQYKEILLIAWKNKSKTQHNQKTNNFKLTHLHKYYLELVTETIVGKNIYKLYTLISDVLINYY